MFPDHYPETCPPTDAIAPDGQREFYRLVTEPLDEKVALSPYDLGWPNSDTCLDRAISLYNGRNGVRRLIDYYPWAKGMSVAKMRPVPSWGLIRTGAKKGASTHTNLWLFESADRNEVVASIVLCDEQEN